MQIEEDVSLASLTTFRLGGPARFLIRVVGVDELKDALAFAKEKNLSTIILGGGSNVLVGDAGFDGLVIKIELTGIERNGDMYIAGAGESWDALVLRAVEDGMWGLENLSGIPGTVGGAPVQNIGAYGAELADTLVWVEVFDTQSAGVIRFENKDCGFGYRTSRFKRLPDGEAGEPGRFVILRAAFGLSARGKPNDSYKDLAGIGSFSLPEIRQKVLAVRAGKFPDLAVEGTAGSFFLNPVLAPGEATRILQIYPECPHFDADGGVKLSLAWLLDKALGVHGQSVGGARLFERQPLVIVAARDARAADVRALAEKISSLAKEKLHITLEPEVRQVL